MRDCRGNHRRPDLSPRRVGRSPRVPTFTDVRSRLLPEIATARYQVAKAECDRKEWASAEQQFRTVLDLLDDPDTGGRLSDLRVLTVGFLELSAKAAVPPPPPPVEPTPAPAAPAPEPSAAAPAPARRLPRQRVQIPAGSTRRRYRRAVAVVVSQDIPRCRRV